MHREIQKRKFYATLPHKLDRAVEEYKEEVEDTEPEITNTFKEEGEFGKAGWSISRSADFNE